MILEVDHLNLCLVLGHKYVHVAVERVTMVPRTYYLEYPGSLTAHVMESGEIVEIMKAVYTQHRPSSFSTRLTRPW